MMPADGAHIKANLEPQLTHAWKYMGKADENPMGINFMSLIFGLGFVMSFGYWCTDFLVVQSAMIARNMSDAQRTPVVAAIPKMLMPLIVVLPGVIAIALMQPALQSKGYCYSNQCKRAIRLYNDVAFTHRTLLSKWFIRCWHYCIDCIFHEWHGW